MAHEQKVAIVTGASQGIGAGIVKGYLDAGYSVVANSRSIQKSDDHGVIAVSGDIGERAVASAVVKGADMDLIDDRILVPKPVFCRQLSFPECDLLRLAAGGVNPG